MSTIHTQNSLFYRDGSSDKVYHIQIVDLGDSSYKVNFQYGRRGSTLKQESKTATGVALEEAQKIYGKIIKEKMAKGYQPATSSEQTQELAQVIEQKKTGIYPKLLNPIDYEQTQDLVEDENWFMQEKFDGERRILCSDGASGSGVNKKGMSVAIPASLEQIAKSMDVAFIVDGEQIGDNYYLFDILELDGEDLRQKSAIERLKIIQGTALRQWLVYTAYTTKEKKELIEKCKENNKEGVVAKKKDSTYIPGRPASGGDALKFKFWESCTAVVSSQSKAKRSVQVQLVDSDGGRVDVGSVTVPSNYAIPEVGAIVEVEYLYAYKGGSLYQSKYKGQRSDQSLEDCSMSQLKFKPEDMEIVSLEGVNGQTKLSELDEDATTAKKKKPGSKKG